MTILEHTPTREEILPFINDCIRQLREADVEARYIVVGTTAYEDLRKAIGTEFQRGAGQFETYHHIPIVLDPFRDAAVCVLPAPAECAKGVYAYRMEE
ncbi:MAG TPA: family 4C encapsulin nanocompartment shell protein [Rhodothermales bacterium]|nr:family 4C encapsulin nanocompartment shell protein [Rhodothermales bacterium]